MTDAKHFGHGLCRRCYMAIYNADNEARIKELKHSWYRAHVAGTPVAAMQREQKHYSGNRRAVLNRDGHKCRHCGKINSLVVHHLDGKGRGHKVRDDGLANLITLCRGCHAKVHRDSHRKFDAATVKTVRRLFSRGIKVSEIVRQTGVSKPYIYQLVRGQYRAAD